jgi:hypothetical protein
MNRAKAAASQLAEYGCAQIWNPVDLYPILNSNLFSDCSHNEYMQTDRTGPKGQKGQRNEHTGDTTIVHHNLEY